MTLATGIPAGTPKDGFRLSMLIYDTRFRAITIQVVVLILFLLLVGWLVSWPSPVMILLAGLAQGVGTFWNAGWRMRTGADDGND